MNKLMGQSYSAPPPANAEGAQGPPPQTNGVMPPPGAPNAMMGPPGAAAPPMGVPQAAPALPPTADDLKQARKHAGAMIDGLMGVLGLPPGKLTKKDVFDAASEMIAKGAFPTSESKQMLIKEMANLPDEEPALRKSLGAFLLNVAVAKSKVDKAYPEAPPMAVGGMPGG